MDETVFGDIGIREAAAGAAAVDPVYAVIGRDRACFTIGFVMGKTGPADTATVDNDGNGNKIAR